MAYVVAAMWRAKPGSEDAVARVIERMTPLSRAEPGCLTYEPHRALADPRLFFLYEVYVDAAGYEAHRATEHFQRYVVGEAIPQLESRDVSFFVKMDA
ncbi:MAG TPA: putative quinol monooxygenase [Chloroflexota bacterium]|nr:putative quinol monooxygenase [Chloroflexota bacterium]